MEETVSSEISVESGGSSAYYDPSWRLMVKQYRQRLRWRQLLTLPHAILGLSYFCIFLFYLYIFYGLISQFGHYADPIRDLGLVMPISLVVFAAVHSLYVLGWRMALVFAVLSLVITWVSEEIGVASGYVPYGAYSYTDLSSPCISYVPVDVPFSWYMMLYPCFSIADMILNGHGHMSQQRSSPPKIVLLALLTSWLMVSWDLVADPLGATGASLWVYKNYPGLFYGVPFLNFVGWGCISFLVTVLYLIVEKFIGTKPLIGNGHRNPHLNVRKFLPLKVVFLPLLVYVGMMLLYVVTARPDELKILAFFVMGFPTVVAVFRLCHVRIQVRSLNADYHLVFEE